jgi:hypothetical protein
MNEREQYADAKKLLKEIQYELTTQPLTPDQRKELEIHAVKLAGILFRPWFPLSWTQRLIMATIVILGVQQAWVGNYQPFVFWLVLPFFSPRILGECSFFIGKLAGMFRHRG